MNAKDWMLCVRPAYNSLPMVNEKITIAATSGSSTQIIFGIDSFPFSMAAFTNAIRFIVL